MTAAQADSKLIFWGAGTSRTFRPIWTAEELGLAYTVNPIGPRTGETQSAEYTELNPKQKIPYLQDGDFGLSESVAISRYLINRYGQEGQLFLPEDLQSKSREDEWICHVYGELDETSLYVMRRHRDLAQIYGEAAAAVTSSAQYAEKHLGVIEAHLQDHEYVMGTQFGLADILLTTCLDWAHFYGLTLTGVLPEYRQRVNNRPAYRRAYDQNFKGGL